MPRFASLYPVVEPSSSTSNNRHPRINHKSYIHSPSNPSSRHPLRFARRPRTSSVENNTTPKPSDLNNQSHTAPVTSWKSKHSFRSRSAQQPPQPLTLEEKLRVAADRIQRFEHQATSEDRPQTKPHTKAHSKIRAGTQSTTKPPIRKRDRLQTRLNTFITGKF